MKCMMWPRWPMSHKECGKPAAWSDTLESGATLYICEDCRVRTGADKENLTKLSEAPPL